MSIRCPRCNRWLAEGSGSVRAVCRECGIEVAVIDRRAAAV